MKKCAVDNWWVKVTDYHKGSDEIIFTYILAQIHNYIQIVCLVSVLCVFSLCCLQGTSFICFKHFFSFFFFPSPIRFLGCRKLLLWFLVLPLVVAVLHAAFRSNQDMNKKFGFESWFCFLFSSNIVHRLIYNTFFGVPAQNLWTSI